MEGRRVMLVGCFAYRIVLYGAVCELTPERDQLGAAPLSSIFGNIDEHGSSLYSAWHDFIRSGNHRDILEAEPAFPVI